MFQHNIFTCLHALKWYCELSNKFIPNIVVIQNSEPHQSQLWQVDLELEAFIKDWIVSCKQTKNPYILRLKTI